MTNSEALVQSDRWIPYAIRSSAARILLGRFLIFYRLSGWIRVSHFDPVSTELSHAVRFDHAIRNECPMERRRFIASGSIAIFRIRRFLPFESIRRMLKNRLIVVS